MDARVSRLSSLLALALLATLAAESACAADGVRTWTDSTGKFKIEARFVSEAGGKVTFARADGKELEIELKKLSAADQKVIEELKNAEVENPFKAKENNPFKEIEGNPFDAARTAAARPQTQAQQPRFGGRDTTPPADADSSNLRKVTVNWSSAELIPLTTSAVEWKVTPPAPTAPAFAARPRAVALPPKSNFFEGLKGLAINSVAQRAVVGYTLADPRPEGQTRVILCDLPTGKATAPATAPGLMVPIALHDDGRQILMCRDEFGFGNQDRLEVWTLQGSRVARGMEWVPYHDVQGAARDVLWAEFLDANTLATSSRGGKVALWNFAKAEPICTFQLADGCVPALSPDRKLIAWCDGKQIGIFDVAKREVIAQQSTPQQLTWPHLAFSPSGNRLGCVASDRALVWDVATGKLDYEIPAAGTHFHGGIDFPHDDYLLAGDRGHVYLLDLKNQLKLWHYQGQQQVRTLGGWTFFAVADHNNAGSLFAAQTPHQAALDLLKKALTQPDLFVFRAGTTVRLDVSGLPDGEQQDKVRQTLTNKLKSLGCSVGENGTIDLVAVVDGPKERQVSYFHSGDYKVQEYFTRLRFIYQGKTAWETSSSNVPGMIMLKRGENIEGKLRESEKPQYGLYDRVELPKFLQKPSQQSGPGGGTTLGSSQVTAAGIR